MALQREQKYGTKVTKDVHVRRMFILSQSVSHSDILLAYKQAGTPADAARFGSRLAISLALILLTITAILHIVPTLLHPLFGSIPVNVYKEPTINGLFGLSAVLLVSLPQILDPDMVILAGLNGLDLVVLATAYKKAARLGGHWFGAIGGATGALVVLCLGPVLLGAIIWSRIMVSNIYGP